MLWARKISVPFIDKPGKVPKGHTGRRQEGYRQQPKMPQAG
jgi:hypothetical protein